MHRGTMKGRADAGADGEGAAGAEADEGGATEAVGRDRGRDGAEAEAGGLDGAVSAAGASLVGGGGGAGSESERAIRPWRSSRSVRTVPPEASAYPPGAIRSDRSPWRSVTSPWNSASTVAGPVVSRSGSGLLMTLTRQQAPRPSAAPAGVERRRLASGSVR